MRISSSSISIGTPIINKKNQANQITNSPVSEYREFTFPKYNPAFKLNQQERPNIECLISPLYDAKDAESAREILSRAKEYPLSEQKKLVHWQDCDHMSLYECLLYEERPEVASEFLTFVKTQCSATQEALLGSTQCDGKTPYTRALALKHPELATEFLDFVKTQRTSVQEKFALHTNFNYATQDTVAKAYGYPDSAIEFLDFVKTLDKDTQEEFKRLKIKEKSRPWHLY